MILIDSYLHADSDSLTQPCTVYRSYSSTAYCTVPMHHADLKTQKHHWIRTLVSLTLKHRHIRSTPPYYLIPKRKKLKGFPTQLVCNNWPLRLTPTRSITIVRRRSIAPVQSAPHMKEAGPHVQISRFPGKRLLFAFFGRLLVIFRQRLAGSIGGIWQR